MDNVLDLTNLNTQNVTNMNAMFKDCNNINEADISSIEMSSVTDASNMFSGCNNLTKLTMTGVDTSNVSNNTQLFDGCDNLKTIVVDSQTDLSGINSQILTNTNVRNIDEYFTEDERLLLKGSERITRELKVQGNIFGDSNHKAHLPNIKSSSIELGDGVVRKIDKDAKSGVVSFDATNEKFVTSDDLTIPGDLVVDGQITARKDLSISGDLHVNGTEHINDVETIQSSDDYFVLRHNKSTALGANEHAGIAVHNYALDKTATLTTDNQGIWRVADNSETSTTYTGVSYYNGNYFTGLTQTATTVIDGIKTAYDHDELDECVIYNGSYYHFDGINWYGVSLVDNVLTVGAKVEDAAVITALEALTRNDLVYYRSLTVTVINEVQNQPLLTREEKSDLRNNDIFAWDATNAKATNVVRPTLNNTVLTAHIDNLTGAVSYAWKSSVSDVLNALMPVGYVYVQYPQTKSPEELWPGFTWQVKDYDGAFFRAQGTNANAFIEKTDSLVKQKQATAKNGLTFSGTRGTVSVSGANHDHGGYTSYAYAANDAASIVADISSPLRLGSCPVYNQSGTFCNHRHPIPSSGNLSMSGNYTPSGSISGDSETRPSNYTIRVWVRTA